MRNESRPPFAESTTPNNKQNMKQTIQSPLTVLALAAAAAALTFASPVAHAQESKAKPAPAWLQKEMDKVTTVVTDLNEEQKTKLAEAIKVRTEALAKVKGSGASPDEVKAKTKDVWSAYTHEVKTFLTDAQFAKFAELHKPNSAASKQ